MAAITATIVAFTAGERHRSCCGVAETMGGISELIPGAPAPAAPPPIPRQAPEHDAGSGPASRTAPAAYDRTGEPAQHGDIGVDTYVPGRDI